MDRQCSSCGGFCKKSGCELITLKPITGANIIRMRKLRGMSAIDLSRAANVPKNTLSELENRTQHPSVWTLYKVANALGCSIEDLLVPKKHNDLVFESYEDAQEAAFDSQFI